MEAVFVPLDDDLGLLPGAATPALGESMVRLGTWLPCGPAAAQLRASFTCVCVGATTARRLTAQAGAAYEAVQTAAVEEIERTLPAGPPIQFLSVPYDGCTISVRFTPRGGGVRIAEVVVTSRATAVLSVIQVKGAG